MKNEHHESVPEGHLSYQDLSLTVESVCNIVAQISRFIFQWNCDHDDWLVRNKYHIQGETRKWKIRSKAHKSKTIYLQAKNKK